MIRGQAKIQAAADEKPEFGTPCAARRMKLFAAAVARGAVTWTSRNWVICKTSTTQQGLVFGRNKPKVEPGTNNIIAAANLEDGEGITARNRVLRDGDGDWVKDGIGYDYRMNETGWCTASRYYGKSTGKVPWEHTDSTSGCSYWSHGMRLVIMDCRTGNLYQYGSDCFLDEEDGEGGIIRDTKAHGSAAYNAVKRAYPELDQLIRRSGVEDIMFGGAGAAETPEQLFDEACERGIITRNGGIVLADAGQLRRYYQALHMVSEIIVRGPTARSMFATTGDMGVSGVMQFPPIDCRHVTDATEMFSGANTTELTLRNTGNAKSMRRMFAGARVNEITGLDTSGAEDITEMFENCRLIVYKFLQLPAFDLASCQKMDRAFAGSAIRMIHLKNASKVQTAVDAFKDCFMLENVPEAAFPLVKAGTQLASGFKLSRKSKFSDDFSKLFDGCAKLPRVLKDDYQKKLDELASWYAERESAAGAESDVLTINSPNDVAANKEWLYEYKTVRLGKCDTENLFYDINGLRIRTLDVNGHENLDSLFNSCQISQIDAIVGTENVKSATQMFYMCELKNPPAMQLPSLCTEMKVFYDMFAPLGMPYVEFGLGVLPPEGIDYTADVNHRKLCDRWLGQNSGGWVTRFGATKCVQKLFQNRYEANREKMLESAERDERGYLIATDEMATQLADIISLKKDLAGVVLRFEKPGSGHGLFSRKRIPGDMPKLDFEGRPIDCGQMFQECTVEGEWGGLEHTEKVEYANSMFAGMKIPRSAVRPFDVSGVKDADLMFFKYQPANGSVIGGDEVWEFKSVSTGKRMFGFCSAPIVLERVKFGESLGYTNSMFEEAQLRSAAGDNCVIRMPGVKECGGMFVRAHFSMHRLKEVSFDSAQLHVGDGNMEYGMFAGCHGLGEITELNFPSTLMLDQMFLTCLDLNRIFTINAPKATMANSMFSGCVNFRGVMLWDSPIDRAQSMCLNSPARFVYGQNGEFLIARNKLLAKGRL